MLGGNGGNGEGGAGSKLYFEGRGNTPGWKSPGGLKAHYPFETQTAHQRRGISGPIIEMTNDLATLQGFAPVGMLGWGGGKEIYPY